MYFNYLHLSQQGGLLPLNITHVCQVPKPCPKRSGVCCIVVASGTGEPGFQACRLFSSPLSGWCMADAIFIAVTCGSRGYVMRATASPTPGFRPRSETKVVPMSDVIHANSATVGQIFMQRISGGFGCMVQLAVAFLGSGFSAQTVPFHLYWFCDRPTQKMAQLLRCSIGGPHAVSCPG